MGVEFGSGEGPGVGVWDSGVVEVAVEGEMDVVEGEGGEELGSVGKPGGGLGKIDM